MKMFAGNAAVACAWLLVSAPALAVDLTLAPGATYSLQLKGQYGIGDGGIFTWDETAASSALYRIQLLYDVYPDQRYCADGPIGCDPFVSSDFRPYSGTGGTVARSWQPFVGYAGNYALESAELRFVSLGSESVSIRNLFNLDPSLALVPEPSTWALMLAGFGMVAYALRRRPQLAYAA